MEYFAGAIEWQSLELQSTGKFKGKRLSENGTAGFLRCSSDNEIGNSRHSTILGAGLMAESRSLRLEWLSSDLSITRGAR